MKSKIEEKDTMGGERGKRDIASEKKNKPLTKKERKAKRHKKKEKHVY